MNDDTKFEKLAENQKRFISKHLQITAPLHCLEPKPQAQYGEPDRYGIRKLVYGEPIIKPFESDMEIRNTPWGIDNIGKIMRRRND